MIRSCFYLILFFVIVSNNFSFAAKEVGKPKVSDKECALCHFQWVPKFIETGKGTAIANYPEDKTEASEKMCVSCHDGSVADSRDNVLNDKHHKTGQKPSSEVPSAYPLSAFGTVECSTCHGAHKARTRTGLAKTVFLRKNNGMSEMCMDCHKNKIGGTAHGNHPVNVKYKKSFPMTIVKAGSKKGPNNEIICQTCHVAHGSHQARLLAMFNEGSQLCLSCHDEKDERGVKNGIIRVHPVDIIPFKARVAPEYMAAGGRVSGQGHMICNSCHASHRAAEKSTLTIIKNNGASNCELCHLNGHYKEVVNSKHNLAVTDPKRKNLKGQTPEQSGPCGVCHNMHQFSQKPGTGPDLVSNMCLSCHSTDDEKKNKEFPHYIHMNKKLKKGMNTELPLFDKLGIPIANGEILCSTCHEPHTRRLLRVDDKSDAADLCTKCHVKSDNW